MGHHAVVGRDDQHDNICGFRAARTHAGEGFVTGCVEEDNFTAIGWRICIGDAHFVSADVLGDASGFALGHVGGADRIEQRGFTVIDVTHDCHHGWADGGFRSRFFFRGGGVDFLRGLLFEGDHVCIGTEEARHFAG